MPATATPTSMSASGPAEPSEWQPCQPWRTRSLIRSITDPAAAAAGSSCRDPIPQCPRGRRERRRLSAAQYHSVAASADPRTSVLSLAHRSARIRAAPQLHPTATRGQGGGAEHAAARPARVFETTAHGDWRPAGPAFALILPRQRFVRRRTARPPAGPPPPPRAPQPGASISAGIRVATRSARPCAAIAFRREVMTFERFVLRRRLVGACVFTVRRDARRDGSPRPRTSHFGRSCSCPPPARIQLPPGATTPNDQHTPDPARPRRCARAITPSGCGATTRSIPSRKSTRPSGPRRSHYATPAIG